MYIRERETASVKTIKQDKGDWMQTKWRPMMAMVYMVINIADFVLFPILWAVVQFWETQAANDAFRQWVPMTLQGGGFIHMAFGAILGISAWTRGQEKVASIQSGVDPNQPRYNQNDGYSNTYNEYQPEPDYDEPPRRA